VAEADEAVGLLAARGQQDHRHPFPGPLVQAAHHLEPVEARQHHVEDDEVGPVEVGEAQRLRPVDRLVGLEAGALEVAGDDLDDRRLVVDHQNGAVALRGHRLDSRFYSGANRR
jgi:hypothetical protein